LGPKGGNYPRVARLSPRSSGDRAHASGAWCAGSNPAGGTNQKGTLPIRWLGRISARFHQDGGMSYQSIQPFLVDGHATLGPARHLVVANLKSKRIEEILQMALRGRHGGCSSETRSSSRSSGDPGFRSQYRPTNHRSWPARTHPSVRSRVVGRPDLPQRQVGPVTSGPAITSLWPQLCAMGRRYRSPWC
jgi:hypothetical protein